MTKKNKDEVIFDLSREDYDYKGVLFAQADHSTVYKEMLGCFPPLPEDYCAAIMAIIWTDEKGIWHFKMRTKFPSGNKQVFSHTFDSEDEKNLNINETYVLQYIYTIPMIKKVWKKNPDGTPKGIVKICEDLDMVEFSKIEPIDS